MASQHDFSMRVGQIYDCVAAPEQWTQTLDDLTTQFEAVITTLAVVDIENKVARFGAAGGDPAVYGPLIQKYAGEVPLTDMLRTLETDVPVTMHQIFERGGQDVMARMSTSRMAREWAQPNRITNSLNLAVLQQPDRVGFLSINTQDHRRAISSNDIEDLANLSPHIRRSVLIGDLFEDQRRLVASYVALLDKLHHAVFILAATGAVLYANHEAEELLKTKQLAMQASGKLIFTDSRAHNAIFHAIATGQKSEIGMEAEGISVPVSPLRSTAVAHVLPLSQRPAATRVHNAAVAAVFVAVSGRARLPAIDAIAALFGLTPAERRAAALAAQGKTRSDIAAICGVSENTVRSQLDAVYAKSGVAGQKELLVLLQELTPALRIDT